MKTALTIAGSDSSGGAGIQADIKTMLTNGVYAMSAVTALTAQNTTSVLGVSPVAPEFLAQQLDAVFTDIVPDAVKTGMMADAALIEAAADRLAHYGAGNIVVDPVMVSTSGARLLEPDAVSALKEKLFPLAALLTPNLPEAEALCGREILTETDMEHAAAELTRFGCAVLVKGGHQVGTANDVLCEPGQEPVWFKGERIDNPNTHGSGCTLSAAIASNLAKGFSLPESVRRAKAYISGALRAMLDLGKGSGPMNHAFAVNGEFVRYPASSKTEY